MLSAPCIASPSLFLALAAAAAASPQTGWDLTPLSLNLDGIQPSVAVKKLLVGDLNESGVPDIAALQDGKIELAIDPSWAEASVSVNGTVNDAEVMRAHPNMGKDILFAVTARGVEQISLTRNGHVLESASAIVEGSLAGALHIGSGDLDGLGSDDIFVVDYTDKDVWVLAESSGSYVLEASSRFSTIGTVDDIKVCRFDAAQAPFFVASTSLGLEVFSSAGVPMATFAESAPNGTLAIVDEGTLGVQRAAWLRNRTGGRRLSVVGPNSSGAALIEASILNIGGGVRTVAARDFDNDDMADLLISRGNGRTLRLLQNINGAFAASGTNTRTLSVSSSAIGADSMPFMEDFDHDGDVDLGIVVPNQASLFVAFNQQVTRDMMAPTILTTIDGFHQWFETEDTTPGRDFFANTRIDRSQIAPTGATAIEAVLWRSTHDSATGKFNTSPFPIERQLVSLTAPLASPPPYLYSEFFFQAFDQDNVDESITYLTVRYVNLDAVDDTVRKAWPVRQSFFLDSTYGDGLAHLATIPFAGTPTILAYEDPFPPGTSGTGGHTGSGGEIPCCPDYPKGCPPGSDEDEDTGG